MIENMESNKYKDRSEAKSGDFKKRSKKIKQKKSNK